MRAPPPGLCGAAFSAPAGGVYPRPPPPPFSSPRSRYPSFLRSLCYYSFVRVRSDPESCEYVHEIMHRDHPDRLPLVRLSPPPLRLRDRGGI